MDLDFLYVFGLFAVCLLASNWFTFRATSERAAKVGLEAGYQLGWEDASRHYNARYSAIAERMEVAVRTGGELADANEALSAKFSRML